MNDDADAWDILDQNFRDDRGVIKQREAGYTPTDEECKAIDYLCAEWDYTWEPQ